MFGGSSLNPQQQTSAWDHSQQMPSSDDSMGVSQFRDHAQVSYNFGPHSHDSGTSGGLSSGSQLLNTNSNSGGNNYLFPSSNPRTRSKSDTSLEPPQWGTDLMTQLTLDNNSALEEGTVNMNDILPSPNLQHRQQPSSAGAHQTSFNVSQQHPHLTHNYTFGPPSSQHLQHQQQLLGSNDFLSPDISLRRSKSDSNGRPGHRQSRSEDIRSPTGISNLFPPTSQQEFLNRQFLLPTAEPVQSIRGHYRRASSGTRSERGASVNGGTSWSNGNSPSQRPSPYPSPNASPRVRYDELPNVALSGRQGLGVVTHGLDDLHTLPLAQVQGGVSGIPVSKPNVTTGRTANASHKRRKQEATFICPVPGCGSTFTRSFNLKGKFICSYSLLVDFNAFCRPYSIT